MDHDIRYNLGFSENGAEAVLAKTLGHLVRVLASCSMRGVSVHEAVSTYWPYIRLNQILFLFNSKGLPVAFVTWMFLSLETAAEYRVDPTFPLDLSDLNEGDQLWVTHVVAPLGDVRPLLQKFRLRTVTHERRVSGVRPGKGNRRSRYVDVRLKP